MVQANANRLVAVGQNVVGCDGAVFIGGEGDAGFVVGVRFIVGAGEVDHDRLAGGAGGVGDGEGVDVGVAVFQAPLP